MMLNNRECHGKPEPGAVRFQRIIRPYYTLKTNGTGLGLTVTFSIIQHHEGSVYFTSGEHSGTTASVRLPAAVH